MLSSPNEGLPTMKRFLALALLIGGSTFGVVGCDQKSRRPRRARRSRLLGGSTTIKDKETVEKTGDHKTDATPSPETPKP